MPSLPRSLGLVPAILNKVWTMNSIAFCYLHPKQWPASQRPRTIVFSRSVANVRLLSELGESVQHGHGDEITRR